MGGLDGSISAWALIALGTVLGAMILGFVGSRRRGRTGTSGGTQPGWELSQLVAEIDARARAHERTATAHYVWVEASRQHVSPAAREALTREHGTQLAMPVLDVSDLFQRGNSTQDVREAIAAWLEAQQLVYEANAPISASLAQPIEERARREATRIVAELG